MKIIKALKTVNYRLWIAILAGSLLPSVYQTFRMHCLGNMPNDWGVNIASQLSWVNLLYEIIQEALILPLFYILGKSLKDRREFANKVRTGVFITALMYAVLSAVIMIFARPLVVFMTQNEKLINATITYIRLETIAALFAVLWRFIMCVLIILKKESSMYIVLTIQMILTMLLDIFLISSLPVSAQLEVNGIAVTNIIVNVIVLTAAFLLLTKEQVPLFSKEKANCSWVKDWFRVGKFSALESLLRNLAFMIMVVRMVNIVAEQGTYWIANNFIWQWLLLPGLALADLIKREIGENKDNIRHKTFGYLLLVSIFALVWLASIPLWKPFLKYILNTAAYETVYKIVLMQTGCYILFLFNTCICDSTFYGLGKTDYMLIQSACIDILYYGTIFILYRTGIFIPTLMGISLMFAAGMALDCIPALLLYKRVLKKEQIRIDFRLAES